MAGDRWCSPRDHDQHRLRPEVSLLQRRRCEDRCRERREHGRPDPLAQLAGQPDLQLRRTGCTKSEEHTSELQSLMRISYAVFCLKKKIEQQQIKNKNDTSQKITSENATHQQT